MERQPTTKSKVNAILFERLFLSTKLSIIHPLFEPTCIESLSILYEIVTVSTILQHFRDLKLRLSWSSLLGATIWNRSHFFRTNPD